MGTLLRILQIVLSVYFIAAIIKPEMVLFFLADEEKRKRWVGVAGLLVSWVVVFGLFSLTDEAKQQLKDAKAKEIAEQKEANKEIAGTAEWYEEKIKTAERDSAQLSRFKVLDKEINNANGQGIGFYVNQFADYMSYDGGVDSLKQYYDDNARLSSLRKYCVKRRAEIMEEAGPKLRKRFIKIAGAGLWEDDIEVEGHGRTITFIAGMFAANRNIKDFEDKVEDTLRKLGFKRVEYKWIRHDDEYTYYNL